MKPMLVALSRWVVGLALLYTGVQKALEPALFLSAMQAYPLASHVPIAAAAALIPWIEIFLGFCLAAGLAPRGSAIWSGLMLIVYTAALIQRAVVSPHEVAWLMQSLDCGCGSGTIRVALKLLENALLIGLCAGCACARADRFVVASID
jgi:uncharacterized membrane protein YphA (DoxX/SURF4 family)